MDIAELLIMLEEIVKDSHKRKASKKQPVCLRKGGSGYISSANITLEDSLRQKLADTVVPEVISGSEGWTK